MAPARKMHGLLASIAALCGALGIACAGGEPAPSPAATSSRSDEATPAARETTLPARTPVPVSTPRPTATPDLGLILPDLTTVASDDVYISVPSSGVRLLHFSTEVHNTGLGPLQVIGEAPEGDVEATSAWQVIETRAAGRVERDVGVLQVNDAHLHWHLDNFAVYELWTVGEDGGLRDLVTSSEKVTFCLIDEFPLDPDDFGDGPQFGPCDPYAQGISPGWGETYEAWLPGQMLDITSVEDGVYALRTILDPDDLLLESNETNNEHVMLLAIDGDNVEPAVELAEDVPPPEDEDAL